MSPGGLILTILSLLITLGSTHALTIFRTYCSSATATNPAGYRPNINTLLSSLSSAASNGSGFRSETVGAANTSMAVYGVYLCRGDQSPASCKDCVATASVSLNTSCPTAHSAFIFYAECMLRYSNDSGFYGSPGEDVYDVFPALQNVTNNLTGFNQVLNATLKKVIGGASEGGAQLKYDTATAQYQDAGQNTLYALAQCTPDLSSRDCRRCLEACIQFLYPNAQGVWVLAFHCFLQYQNYLFYTTAALTPPPPSNPAVNSSVLSSPVNPTPINTRAKKSSSKVVIGVISALAVAGLIGVVICVVKGRKKRQKVEVPTEEPNVVNDDFDTAESLLYDLDALHAATNNFSDDSKIGQGGFGSVYKGTMPDGHEIAVKRLSTSSGQVAQELKNEVILVAKLQHRNLLRLLGFCLAGDEKLLVYEYAPNKSLNMFLFEKRGQLDWPTRYKIMSGIARGMLYLHEDSQLRIIHRDLKASNVLLDANMNPKISDFGIARVFNMDQTQGNTCKVVGTYGYMAPEYAMHGKFSVKSDVYSFGVLVLEIISGKRNNNFYASGNVENLLSYAWKVWSIGRPLEFVDPTLRNSCSNNEVIRCIHLGLLCVQDDMLKRPSMEKIVLMLSSYSVNLPTPQQPAVFLRRRTSANVSADQSTSKSVSTGPSQTFWRPCSKFKIML